MKIKENGITAAVIEEAIEKDHEQQAELKRKAEEKRIQRDLLKTLKLMYLNSDERFLQPEIPPATGNVLNKDPFFRIKAEDVKSLLQHDKENALKAYHTWKRPDITGKKEKKEFVRNAIYIGGDKDKDPKKDGKDSKKESPNTQTETKSPEVKDEDALSLGGSKANSEMTILLDKPEPSPVIPAKKQDKKQKSKVASGSLASELPSPPKKEEPAKSPQSQPSPNLNPQEVSQVTPPAPLPETQELANSWMQRQGLSLTKREDKHAKRYPLDDDWQLTQKKEKQKEQKKSKAANPTYEPDKGELPMTTYFHRKAQLESITRSRAEFSYKMDNV